jgi:hypothetical protein
MYNVVHSTLYYLFNVGDVLLWCWRRTEISCTDHVRNVEVLLRAKEQMK